MSVEQVSDSVWFVFFAYIAAFLPWSFLAAKDFVGPRWKTIKDTRTSGWYTAAFSVIPACYVMAYMIVQGLSSDFKEMCAALVALVFSLLNFLRTVWGLWQLDYFREWAMASIRALKAMGVQYVITNPNARKVKEIGDMVDHLLVNESIVDNQLAHGEARCLLKYRDVMLNGGRDNEPQVLRHVHSVWQGLVIVVRYCFDYGRHIIGEEERHKIEMVPVEPANVWLNWSVAFAAQGLGGWIKEFSASRDPEDEPGYDTATSKERFERRGQHFGLQLVNSALVQLWYENGLCEDDSGTSVSTTSPLHWCDVWDENSFMKDGVIVKKELLRKAMESGIALPFRASHRASRDKIMEKDVEQRGGERPGYHAYRRKLGQIVNEVPVRGEFDENVGEFDSEKLEWLTILLYMGRIAVRRREEIFEQKTMTRTTTERSDNDEEEMKGSQALKNLRTQVYLRNSSDGAARKGGKVYSTSQLFQSVSVRMTQPPEVCLSEYNRHVAKVGEMIDAWISLFRGNKMRFLSDLNESEFWEDVCCCGNASSTEEDKIVSFCSDDSKAIQGIHSEVEKRQFYYNLANEGNKYKSCDQFITFMGYGMETVRSRLGSWVANNRDEAKSEDVFAPLIENVDEMSVDLGVKLSDVLFDGVIECSLRNRGVQTRLIWELQQALAKASDRGPGSASIIMLCVLSFPSVSVELKEEGRCRREEVTCEAVNNCVVVGFCDCVGRKTSEHGREDERLCFAEIKICANGGPQRVEIVGRISERDGVLNVKLRLRGSDEAKRFRWTLWRDAFLGRLKGLKEWQEEHGIQSAELTLTHGEMGATMENVELSTGEKVVCWGGWKPFRVEFMRFELESEGFLKEQFVAGEEEADHFVREFNDVTKREQGRGGQLLPWQAKFSMYVCLDSLPRMRVEPVKYTKASAVTLRHASLIVQEALVGAGTDLRTTEERDPSKVLMRHAEECLRNGNDWERAVSVLEIAASVYGSGRALERCVRLLIEQSQEERVAIRVVRLLERFLAQLYSALRMIEHGDLLLFHTNKADEYVFATCLKVMEWFGDDDVICERLSTLFLHVWLINQAYFEEKTVAALQTLYCQSGDIRVMGILSQVLYDEFSSVKTDKRLEGNIERFTGVNGSMAESHSSVTGKLNRDTLQACKTFLREAASRLEGKQGGVAKIRLATVTAWGSGNTDEVYQKAVALYKGVAESSEGLLPDVATISWATLIVEGYDGGNEKELEDLIDFTIKRSHIDGESGIVTSLAEALRRGPESKAQSNMKWIGLYHSAIEAGSVRAMYNMALMLREGAEGVAQDAVEAAKLYRSAIEGGHVGAMYNMASMLEHGAEGVAQDAVEAAKLYHTAIEGGDVKAIYNLASMLEDGAEGIAQDAVEAAKLYRSAIERGHVGAMFNMALMLQHGAEGVAQDAVEAAKLYRSAIESGVLGAMFNMALMLHFGAEGIAQDAAEAVKLYRSAVKRGHVGAMHNMALMLQHGAEGVAQDVAEAANLYRSAIEGGNAGAMFNMALMLQHGAEGVAPDAVEAANLYRRAIDRGDVDAMYNMALMLHFGTEGVAQDAVEAAKLYCSAIESGNVGAMYNLAVMLQDGAKGIAQDAVEAAKLYRSASEGGNVDAMFSLALMLQYGAEGVAPDAVEAAELYHRAIECGDVEAMFRMALMFQYGAEGVAQDVAEAANLYHRAIEGGHVGAMFNMALMLHYGAGGVAPDAVGATNLYRRAIARGHVHAMYNMALMLHFGTEGVAQDAAEAAKLYCSAIEGGHVGAMYNMALMLQYGAEGVVQDAAGATSLYRRAIARGHVHAMYNMALMLHFGTEGIAQDAAEAAKLYRSAIECEHVGAMFNMALMLEHGAEGVAQNAVEAAKLYCRAIEGGQVAALYNMALMLEHGAEGVAQDAAGATSLYRRAIARGHVHAMYNMALMLHFGTEGVAQDTAEAAKLYRSAIEGGHVGAMYNMALILQYGAEGVAQDAVEAAKLYHRAIENGNVDGMYNLAVLLQNGSEGVESNVEEAKQLMNRAWEGLCNGGFG